MKRPQSPLLTMVKAAAGTTSLLLFLVVGTGVATALTPASLAIVAAAVLIGYLGADFLSGSVHWFCDSFFREDTPLIGRTVIWPFRDHHRHPTAITRYRLLEQDATSYFILIPPLATAVRRGVPEASDAAALALHAALCGFAVGAFGTNLFHKWAHSADVGSFVAWLQRHRLILSPEAHRVHHRTYTGGYCVTSGWLNRGLDAVDFFGRLERCIRFLMLCLPAVRSRAASHEAREGNE